MTDTPALFDLSTATPTELAKLHRECFGPEAWSEAMLASSLGLKTSFGWCVKTHDAKKYAGFILCQRAADEAEILTLCIAPMFRRHGMAKKLVEKLIRHAKTHGINRIHLEVAADNLPALRLYESCGFSRNSARKNYYRRGTTEVDAITCAWSSER